MLFRSPFKIKLPVRLEGFSRGVRNGGRLRQNFRKLKVFGLAKDMPETISIDITPIRIGQKRRVSDLSISGLKFLDPSNAVVVCHIFVFYQKQYMCLLQMKRKVPFHSFY